MKKNLTKALALPVLAISLLAASCATPAKIFSAKGTVQEIQPGKDGYTALMKDNNGKDFDAVISRVKMQTGYKTLQPGDVVELFGDTMRLDDRLRILVNKIEP